MSFRQGPRAVLNAVERLASGYGSECDRVRQDLSMAESQLLDYGDRLGKPFPHEKYLSELTELRDQLKAGLSASAPDENPVRSRQTGWKCRFASLTPHCAARSASCGSWGIRQIRDGKTSTEFDVPIREFNSIEPKHLVSKTFQIHLAISRAYVETRIAFAILVCGIVKEPTTE